MGSCEDRSLVDEPSSSSGLLSIEEAGKGIIGDKLGGECLVPCLGVASEHFMDGGSRSVEQSAAEQASCVKVHNKIGGSIDERTMTCCDNAMASCLETGAEAAAVHVRDIGLGGEVEDGILPVQVPDIECRASRMCLSDSECERVNNSILLGSEEASRKKLVCHARVGLKNSSGGGQMCSESLHLYTASSVPSVDMSVKRDAEVMEEKSGGLETELCSKVLHLSVSQMGVDFTSLCASQGFQSSRCKETDAESAIGHFVKNVKNFSPYHDGTEVAPCEGIFDVGKKSLQVGSSTVDHDLDAMKSIKETTALQPNVSIFNDSLGAANTVSVDDIPCRVHKSGKDSARLGNASEVKFPGNQPSSLRRSSRANKYVQKTEEKVASRKLSIKPSNISYPDGPIDLFLKTARRKRSFSRKSTRSSDWGLMKNLSQYFVQSCDATMQEILNHKTRKLKGNQKNRKQRTFQALTCSRGMKRTKSIPTGTVRLKVIFGKKTEQNIAQVTPLGAEAVNCSGNGGKVTSGDNIPHSALICMKIENPMDNKFGENPPQISPKCFPGNSLEEQATCQNHVHNDCSEGKDVDFSVFPKKALQNLCMSTSQTELEKSSSNGDRFLDPGTSPDSEVINNVPESRIEPIALEGLRNSAVDSFDCIANSDVPDPSNKARKKGNKKDKISQSANIRIDDSVKCPAHEDKSNVSKKSRQPQKIGNCCGESCTSTNSSGFASISEQIRVEQSFVANKHGLEAVHYCNQTKVDSRTDARFELVNSRNCEKLIPQAEPRQQSLSKSSKSKGKCRSKSKISDSTLAQIGTSNSCRGDKKKLGSKTMIKNDIYDEAHIIEAPSGTGNNLMEDEATSNSGVTYGGAYSQAIAHCGVNEGLQRLHPKKAWVCCDDCDKWRCISAALADFIEKTNCRWSCKDNHDKAFADCSIPQEKSNEEINAELEISDEEDSRCPHLGSKAYGSSHAKVYQPPSWMHINTNLFLHRGRKSQTMDEVMVCHCKLPRDGRLGCKDECLNRMLNIECLKGTCPCEDLCSNQQFQKRKYAQLKLFRCGKKGHGLQVLEDISQGQFIIEYVGEVLDLPRYEARQRDYASKGHKHFYFMTLNGNEVIDACAKGNLGRYINHSCDPNCRTEKWMVNGEICIGLFAIRNINKGEELTFDYNYVRVFGAAAKQCYCGAAQCRGYIGGDLHNAEVIVQGDSDDEYLDPVVVLENGEIQNGMENVNALSSLMDVKEMETADFSPEQTSLFLSNNNEMMKESKNTLTAVSEQLMDYVKDSTNESFDPPNIDDLSGKSKGLQTDDVLDKSACQHQQEMPAEKDMIEMSSLSSQRSHSSSENRQLRDCLPEISETGLIRYEAEIAEGKQVHSKSRPRMKVSRPSKSVKNHSSSCNVMNEENVSVPANKPHVLFNKPKKLLEASTNGHLEAVEEKLNDLLDIDGGICKRKDASRGYLKLLLLTAASGDNGNGGTIQSNRDLSMILDAMLKTKSRAVLVDIINKNGLQMLHNMMKQYRRDFKKIPILRKLLKVLEFLAEKAILTGERINADSRCLGVESLRESILTLTEHQDKKIHQISRSFRDKWIPRVRKISCMDTGERKAEVNRFMGLHCWRDHETRPSKTIDCTKLSVQMSNTLGDRTEEGSSPQVNSCVTAVVGTRKRKSRWDQPADPEFPCKGRKVPNLQHRFDSGPHPEVDGGLQHIIRASHGEKSLPNCVQSSLGEIKNCEPDDARMDLQEDAPPGFSLHPAGFSSPPPGFSSTPPGFCCSRPPGFSSAPPGFFPSPDGSHPHSFVDSTMTDIPEQNENQLQYRSPTEVSMGQPQKRFNSRLPVAYGIPFSVLQQSGMLQRDLLDGWVVAPGIPFHPFPPLPTYPHGGNKGDCPNSSAVAAERASESEGQARQGRCFPTSCHADQDIPSTSGLTCLDVGSPGSAIHHPVGGRGSSYSLGRKYFRQQKWNNLKHRPLWLRKVGWGFEGNYPQNGDLPNDQSGQVSLWKIHNIA
ncbi:hypothetical protein Dimus_005312 [Dionaea muscipula]